MKTRTYRRVYSVHRGEDMSYVDANPLGVGGVPGIDGPEDRSTGSSATRNICELLETACRTISTVSTELSRLQVGPGCIEASQDSDHSVSAAAAAELTARSLARWERQRETCLPSRRFPPGAWNVLLDLYIAGVDGRTVSLTSASLATGLPVSTGLRLIHDLERQGHLIRRKDARDSRRYLVDLSDGCRDMVTRLLLHSPWARPDSRSAGRSAGRQDSSAGGHSPAGS